NFPRHTVDRVNKGVKRVDNVPRVLGHGLKVVGGVSSQFLVDCLKGVGNTGGVVVVVGSHYLVSSVVSVVMFTRPLYVSAWRTLPRSSVTRSRVRRTGVVSSATVARPRPGLGTRG